MKFKRFIWAKPSVAKKPFITLGIESSCDETGIGLYSSDQGLIAHKLFSQVDLHAEYGGVCLLYTSDAADE